MLITPAYAQAAGAATQENTLLTFLPMVAIFVVFYFLLIRPQQKKMKEHKKMVEELKKGDEIVTAGGIYGTVEGVTPETLTVKIAEGTKVKITRSSVAAVVTEKERPKE